MSRPITVEIPHQLGAAEARRRIEHGFAKLAEQMGASAVGQATHAWIGDRMTFSFGALGQVISGELRVFNDVVQVEAVLPGILGVMADAVRAKVEKQVRLLLGKK
jgi:hypothetical protein